MVRGVLGEEAALVTELDGLVDCGILGGRLRVFVGFLQVSRMACLLYSWNSLAFIVTMMIVVTS